MSAIAEEGDEKEENKKGIRDLENITDKIKVTLGESRRIRYTASRIRILPVMNNVFYKSCRILTILRGLLFS